MRFTKKIIGILIIYLVLCLNTIAQDRSNRGKEFWLGYGFNYKFLNELPLNNQELALYISTETAANVIVSINATGWTQTLNIPANTVDASILIPKSGPNDARVLTDGFSDKGIHIVSDVPIAVYAHQYGPLVSGATMLMPVETFGFSYYSINYYQTKSESNPPDWYSWFFVIAAEDNTRVQITPSDSTKNGWLPGQTYTVNLNKGEMYHVFGKAGPFNTGNFDLCSKDMTGSKIISVSGADGKCHPVGVFSGSGGLRLCKGDGGEFVHQQVFPAQAWGTRYLTYHTINNTNTDINETFRNYYRVCVQDPATVVKRNGTVLTGLVKNFFYEFMDSTGGDYIEADKPILVAQYTPNKNECWRVPPSPPAPPSYGDPEMFYISPIEQGQKSVLFYVSRKSTIDFVYANIHLPTAAIASLKVDGASLPATNIVTHPNYPSYSVALARFAGPAAQHNITCDSAFTATVYGLGNYESYGYNVGTLINNLNYYSAIKNSFNNSGVTDTFTCPKTPVRLFVKLGYPATTIHWRLSQVSGITPAADSIISNPVPVATEQINGRTYYVYSLQQDFIFNTIGTFYVPLTYGAAVIENCSQTENASVKVVVKQGPVANFIAAAPACLKDSVLFTGTAITNNFTITNYSWNFDDATTATGVNTIKKFNTAGTQNVRYRIFASNGCAADTTKAITIYDTPVALFGATSPICAADSARFTDSSSIGTGTITAWQWSFGDATTIINNNNNPFYHLYTQAGTYNTKLVTVSDNNCPSDTAYKTITVLPKPQAKFGYSGNICAGDSILLTDSSVANTGSLTNWRWNFGDNTTATYNNNNAFYHPYTQAGTYTVSLIVTASTTCASDTFYKTIVVSNRPQVSFTSAGVFCADSSIQFISSYTPVNGVPATWYWNFGDGQQLTNTTSNTASHTYTASAGNIIVKHVLSLGKGCSSDTASFTINAINNNPVAQFSITATDFCERSPISFNSTLTNMAQWNWSFGNGSGNNTPPFTRTYTNAGNYSIDLTVKDNNGCGSAPVTQTITINTKPLINAGPDLFINPGATVLLAATVSSNNNVAFNWQPATYLNNNTVLQPTSTPPATITYNVTAVNTQNGCSSTDAVTVTVITQLSIPNAFTPNNDGHNDAWVIPGIVLYPNAVVKIYNRWGQKVYESTDYYNKPWNGKLNGQLQPNGSYAYIIKLHPTDTTILRGSFMLIR
ncbi:MAG: PKD domain-containing protein [Flavihumibacter sp.]|nr:PKD domain-containing protein [Flavihumibacter sp.]